MTSCDEVSWLAASLISPNTVRVLICDEKQPKMMAHHQSDLLAGFIVIRHLSPHADSSEQPASPETEEMRAELESSGRHASVHSAAVRRDPKVI